MNETDRFPCDVCGEPSVGYDSLLGEWYCRMHRPHHCRPDWPVKQVDRTEESPLDCRQPGDEG